MAVHLQMADGTTVEMKGDGSVELRSESGDLLARAFDGTYRVEDGRQVRAGALAMIVQLSEGWPSVRA